MTVMRVLLFVLHVFMLRECEGARVTEMLVWDPGGGVVAVSACMCGTRGSGVLFSTGGVLEMSVVRGVGGVCDMCMCLDRAGVGGEGGEWMRELGLGIINPVGTGGVLDMCLCFGCGGVGRGLGPGSGAVGWCYVCVRCESGFSV